MLMAGHFRTRLAAGVARDGGVIAYPTEAVWGLGCDPDNSKAVEKLLSLKQRKMDKGLILIAAHIDQFKPYLSHLTPAQYQQLQQSWPGPVTWLVPANERVPDWIRGQHTSVALRVTKHPLVQELTRVFGGPIVSTSANPAGMNPATTALRARQYFGQQVDYYLNGPLGGLTNPSEIRDLLTGQTLRAGGS